VGHAGPQVILSNINHCAGQRGPGDYWATWECLLWFLIFFLLLQLTSCQLSLLATVSEPASKHFLPSLSNLLLLESKRGEVARSVWEARVCRRWGWARGHCTS
jgi:hypothetical protein